ncbi:MAG TPA: hypothetical protein VD908_12965, partial [Cytophagales bacterium]|nr:hypothetical protein [Cytophagales bacterium]
MKKIYILTILVYFLFLKGFSQCIKPEGTSKASCLYSGTLSVQSYAPVDEMTNISSHKWYTSQYGTAYDFETTPVRPYPSSSVLVSTINVSGSKTYWVSTVCGSDESDRLEISYIKENASLIQILGPGYSQSGICPNTEFKLYADGGRFYKWYLNGGFLGESSFIIPSQPGTYVLSGIPDCGSTSQSDSFEFKFKNNPSQPIFGKKPTSVCRGSTSEYSVTSTDTDRYEWALSPTSAGTITYTFNNATVKWNSTFTGAATVKATAFGCSSTSASVAVNVIPPLTLELPKANNSSICRGGLGTISASTTNSNITHHDWYNSNNVFLESRPVTYHSGSNYVSTYSVNHTEPGTYTYYVSSSPKSVMCPLQLNERTPVTFTVKAPGEIKIIPLGVDMTESNIPPVCEGDSDFALKADGGSDYIWKNAGGVEISRADSISPTESGIYYLTGINNCGDAITTSRSVTIIQKTPSTPIFTLKETSFCQGHQSSNYRIEASNAYSYSWSVSPPEAGEVTFNSTNATVTWNTDYSETAQVTATAFGCNGVTNRSSSVTVTINPIVPLYPPQVNSLATCVGGTLSLSATSYNDPSVTEHIWYTSPTGNETITPTQNGRPNESINFCTSGLTQIFTSNVTYYVAAVRNDGTCGEDESVRVPVSFTVVPNPTAPLIDASSILKIPANTATILKITGGENYKWFNQSGMEVYRGNNFYTSNLSETTTYSVCTYAPDAPSCESSRKTMTVTVYHVPKVIASADQKLALSTGASTTSVTLPGSATDADGSIISYSWEK